MDYSEEALPERDPSYELPHDSGSEDAPTLTMDEDRTWREMVRRRPMLAWLRAA